jgi:hypothetical protein
MIDKFELASVSHTTRCSRNPDPPSFKSNMVQDYLCEVDETSPDILFLYDCCHPANGHGSIKSSRSSIALLAACGFESVAAEIGMRSFTNALVHELSEATRKAKTLSVLDLHRNVLNRLHQQQPNVILQQRNGKACVRTDKDIPLFECPVWRTPIYVQLSKNARPRPIMLAPLPRKSVSSDSHDFIDLNAQSPAGSTSPELKETQMHVLLRVSLKENKFDWKFLKTG